MKKFLKGVLITVIALLLIVIAYALYYAPAVMTGMAAKTMCSCVFVMNRTPESVLEKEFRVFPGLDLTDPQINRDDFSVTTRILWKQGKAIYREGLGCTLLAERPEREVRNQAIETPNLNFPANIDSVAWPMGDRIDSTSLKGIDYDALHRAIDQAFADIDPENPVNTHGVVVLYDGHLIGEKYAPGFDHRSRLMGWSMTKSITNALMGIMVKEGYFKVDDPAPIAEWQNDERKNITINHLLQASAGLEWKEGYFDPASDFHTMFIRSDDKARFAASREQESKPGSVFEYSSGTTNIISRIIREKIGDANYYKYPYEMLFQKIGMYRAIIEPDASGTFVASSYGYASARDWARFGLLYLNDGVWNGERILPEGWVKYSTTPAPAAPMREYGAQIWLNRGAANDPSKCKYPGLPNDAFVFDGFEENSVVVIPSRRVVVARLGVTHNSNFNHAALIQQILAAVPASPHPALSSTRR